MSCGDTIYNKGTGEVLVVAQGDNDDLWLCGYDYAWKIISPPKRSDIKLPKLVPTIDTENLLTEKETSYASRI